MSTNSCCAIPPSAPVARAMLELMQWLGCVRSEVAMPVLFNTTQGSHMVLQQSPAKSAVYGTVGAGGTAVVITIAGTADDGTEEATYTVDAAATGGLWKAFLKPTLAGGSYTITAKCTGCKNTTAAVLEDVTFGDLWQEPSPVSFFTPSSCSLIEENQDLQQRRF